MIFYRDNVLPFLDLILSCCLFRADRHAELMTDDLLHFLKTWAGPELDRYARWIQPKSSLAMTGLVATLYMGSVASMRSAGRPITAMCSYSTCLPAQTCRVEEVDIVVGSLVPCMTNVL